MPMTTREITEHMLGARGIANPNANAVRNPAASILACLRNHKGKGMVKIEEDTVKWQLKSL
jgi:hypothetical protein